jgi:hypothetical protein
VPEIVIADPKIFCGSPGERITYGVLIKKAAETKSVSASLVERANLDLTGSIERIELTSYAEKYFETS